MFHRPIASSDTDFAEAHFTETFVTLHIHTFSLQVNMDIYHWFLLPTL